MKAGRINRVVRILTTLQAGKSCTGPLRNSAACNRVAPLLTQFVELSLRRRSVRFGGGLSEGCGSFLSLADLLDKGLKAGGQGWVFLTVKA